MTKDELNANAAVKIAQLEKAKGRKLSPREQLLIGLPGEGLDPQHRRPSDPMAKIAAVKWQPVKATDANATIYDAELAKLEAQAAKEADMKALASASPNSRSLLALQQAKRKELEGRAQSAAIEAHLKENAHTISTLRDLLETARWDERYSETDILQIQNSLAQVETPNGDAAVTAQMFQASLGLRSAIIKEQASAVAAKTEQLRLERNALNRELRALEKAAAEADPLAELYRKYQEAGFDQTTPEAAAYWQAKEAAEGKAEPAAA